MRRRQIFIGAVLLAAVALVVFAQLQGGPPAVRAAGNRYAVSVRIADRIEVRVTKGDADRVIVAAVMPDMGHALPAAGAREVEPGLFVVPKPDFGMDGAVELTVTLTGAPGREVITLNTLVTS